MCYSKFNIKGQLRIFRRMDIVYLTRTRGGLDPGKAKGRLRDTFYVIFFTLKAVAEGRKKNDR